MKLSIVIEGTPRISQNIHYTRKGMKYKPETELENEKALRAGVVSSLPFDFKPLNGALRILKLHFIFLPSHSVTKEELIKISQSELIEKNSRPDITDCLASLFKAMLGTVFNNETQICGIKEVYKYYGANPGIVIEIEEISD